MKIDTKSIIGQYDAKMEDYRKVANEVQYLLIKKISDHGIKTHSINYRIKGLDSFLDKVRRKKIDQPFEKIHDVIGFRVVCLFLSDLEEIKRIIKDEFDVFEEDDKINDSEINIFGYMSLHLKAKLKIPKEQKKSNEASRLPFEIQIRTIAQDAWASISHYLDYKKESFIPEQLKRGCSKFCVS